MEKKLHLHMHHVFAAEYACTTYPDDFADATKATMKISEEEIIQTQCFFTMGKET